MRDAEPTWHQEFPFRCRELTVDGYRLSLVDECPASQLDGPGQVSPTLLMVHGNPTWSFHFRALIRRFAGAYRVVAPDHLGCGRSEKPQAYDYSLPRHAANLAAIVDQLDLQRITLIAHDWGGAIGLLTATAAWHRFESIVLLNTAAFPPPYIPWRIRACRIPWVGPVSVRGANLFARAAQYMAVKNRRTITPSARAGLLAPYDNWSNRVAIDRFVRDIPGHPGHPTWHVLENLERGLRHAARLPVLLVWGMQDWCFRPSCLYRLQEIFPHHQTVQLPNVGHWVLEEAPERAADAIADFLAAPSGQAT